MKRKTKITRTVALGTALAFSFTMTALADGWRVGNVKNGDSTPFEIGNYTFTAPSLSGTKLILQDPKLADKSWVEYVEYDPRPISEIREDNIIYYIYQPSDYAVSSIMAIKDYNPDEITGSSANLAVSLGELGSIFEAAALGTGISNKLLGGNFSAETVANEMTSTNDIVKNSKYYATPEFMGIPGDKEYRGVSNSGYYNASSMTISITKSSSVQVTKTNTTNASLSVGSNESTSVSLSNTAQTSNSRTVSNTSTDTSSKSVSIGNTHTDNSSDTHTDNSSDTHTDNSSDTHTNNVTNTHENSSSHTSGYSKKQNTSDAVQATGNVIGALASFVPGLGFAAGAAIQSFAGQISEVTKGFGDNTWESSDQTSNKDSHSEGSSDSHTDGSSDSHTDGSSDSHTDGSSDSHSETNTNTVSNAISKAISDANSVSNSSTSGSSASTGTNASTSIGYGLNYAQSQQTSISQTISRTFSSRDDDEVKNVGWKLCQYVVRVPYYIEAVKVDGAEETLIYSQYVTYDLLTGISRVFANGYIEHWNTGDLVPYADFFEGFVTAQELVDTAKKQAKDK